MNCQLKIVISAESELKLRDLTEELPRHSKTYKSMKIHTSHLLVLKLSICEKTNHGADPKTPNQK